MKDRVVTVQIPAGIHDGQAVRVRGEGEPGEDSAQRGDLHCYVRISPHPFFERHNNDLVCRMPISFTQASLGAKVEVPTLIVASSGEPHYVLSGAQTLYEGIPESAMDVIEDADRFYFYTRHDLLNGILSDFLTEAIAHF